MPTKNQKPQTIISFHIGQAGIQMGGAMWELLAREHNLTCTGFKSPVDNCMDKNARAMFHHWSGPKYTARACFIDSDECTLTRLRNGPHRAMFQSNYFISSKAESGGLYYRGYKMVADEVVDDVKRWVHRMAEGCDYPFGFLFTHSMGGGTGSGVTSKLLEVLKTEYPKSSQVQLAVMPNQKKSNLIVEPYNISLLLKDTLEHSRAVILVDNEALLKVVNSAGVKSPTYNCINGIIAQVLSAISSGTRYSASVRFSDIETNIVASRHLRFATSSFAPLSNPLTASREHLNVAEVINTIYSPRMQHLTADFYTSGVITTTVMYRSCVDSIGEVRERLDQLIGKNAIRFVPWVPTSIKVGMIAHEPKFIRFYEAPRSAVLLSNTTAVVKPLDTICKSVTSMLKKQAFQHWYTRSGMFSDELTLAKESLTEMIEEYTTTSNPL